MASEAQLVTLTVATGASGYVLGKLGGQLLGASAQTQMIAGAAIGGYSAYKTYSGSMSYSQPFIAAGAAAAGYLYPMAALGKAGSAAVYGGVGYFVFPMVVQYESQL